MIRYILTLIFTCAWLCSYAQVNIITTIAGTGVHGYNGDGIPATNAQLNWPSNIRAYKDGSLLIIDPDNARVRKISTTGIISTIAGNGIMGDLGNNGPATNAQLFAPQGVCTDSSGNIYIADGLNHKVKKIAYGTGIITTIAGNGTAGYSGNGTSALTANLNAPCGLYVYNDDLFIADYNNAVVRKVNLPSGIITTIAGTGVSGYSGNGGLATDAQFSGVIDVFCDAIGNLFIADQFNGAIRRVDAITGIITTVAGNGTLGYSGNDGPATAAQMNEAAGVFVDKHNNLFIADYRNGAIRRVDAATQIITTVAGGVAGYGGDSGPATNAKLKCVDVYVDDWENIYIADYANHRVRKVNGALKVNELNKVNELALYPNPTTGKFEVQSATSEGVITVCNIAGSVVFQSATFTAKTEVDISKQPPGVYMVYVQSGEDRYVSKMLLQ